MRIVIVMVLALFAAQFSMIKAPQAQEYSVDKKTSLIYPNIQHEGESKNYYLTTPLSQPIEPHFKEVTFLSQPEPKTLSERVDRMVHGIKTDIPPEYDHYGYEIRRYMKSIMTPQDLNNTLQLPKKIQSAKTARIILDYWKKALSEERNAIQVELDKGNVSSSLITTFRYNSGVINEFIPDAYLWVDRNIEYLEFLQEHAGEYYIEYPFHDISNKTMRDKYIALYDEREQGLRRILKYSPFRAMIY